MTHSNEEELYELFKPHAPAAEAFRNGIDQRMAELAGTRGRGEDLEPSESTTDRAEPGSGRAMHLRPVPSDAIPSDAVPSDAGSPDAEEAPIWRRVASLVPLDPFSGAMGGATLSKAFGGKLLPAALVLPAAIVAASVGAFAFGARSLGRTTAGADELVTADGLGQEPPAPPRWIAWLPFAFLIAIVAFRGSIATDLITVYLAVTMLSLVLLVRGLARVGRLRREEVTKTVNGIFLSVVGIVVLQSLQLGFGDGTSAFGLGISALAIFAGWFIIDVIVHRRVRKRALMMGALYLVLFNGLGVTYSTPRGLRFAAERASLSPYDLSGWDGSGAACRALASIGAPLPDYGPLRAELLSALRAGTDPHPAVLSAALEMGLIQAAEVAELDDSPRRKLIGTEPSKLNTTLYYRYELPALLATTTLLPEERQHLVECLRLSWPEAGSYGALEVALRCFIAFEHLGVREEIEKLTEATHALLEHHWVSKAQLLGRAGGFTPDPEQFATSFDSNTLAGVELMGRVGVPDGIDLYRLRAYLRHSARALPVFPEVFPSLKLEFRAALLRLERDVGLPERTWYQKLLAERLLLTCLLTVLLALYAVRLAPTTGPFDEGGAQP